MVIFSFRDPFPPILVPTMWEPLAGQLTTNNRFYCVICHKVPQPLPNSLRQSLRFPASFVVP